MRYPKLTIFTVFLSISTLALKSCSGNLNTAIETIKTTDKGDKGPPVTIDGSSCRVEQNERGATIVCDDGSSAEILNGNNGSSCSVYPVESGAVVECGDGSYALLKNGVDGIDGQDGVDGSNGQNGVDGQDGSDGLDAPTPTLNPYALVEIVDPCGKETQYDEVLLRFQNGDILAHYSDSKKQHFTLIGPGNYQTTDGTSCLFSINSEGSIEW